MAVRREVFSELADADIDAALRVFAAIRAAATGSDDQPA